MLAKCANPACGTPFRHLNQGKLFQVEGEESVERRPLVSLRRRRHYVERYWLCDACAARFTLTFEEGRGVVPVSLATPASKRPTAAIRPVRPAFGYVPAARVA